MARTVVRLLVALLIFMVLIPACEEGPSHGGRKLSSWIRSLESEHKFKRRQACEAIAAIGPPAEVAIPHLIQVLKEDDNQGVREFAREALVGVGDASVPHLTPLLDGPDAQLRVHAALALSEIDPANEAALDQLMEILIATGDAQASKQASRRVTSIGAPALDRLLKRLDDPYPPARIALVRTLAAMNERAAGTIPRLLELVKAERDAGVRREIVVALARVGTAETVAGPLRELMNDPDPAVANKASEMVVYVGGTDRPTTGAIEEFEAAIEAGEIVPEGRSLLSEPAKRDER